MATHKKKLLPAEHLRAIRQHQGQWKYLVRKYKVGIWDIWAIKNGEPPYDDDYDDLPAEDNYLAK